MRRIYWMVLPSWIVLTACKKWLHSGYYCPRGLVRPAKRQRNVWTSRLMNNPRGGRGSPFKFLESVCLWFDEKDWIWGQRVRVTARVPYLLLLGAWRTMMRQKAGDKWEAADSSWLKISHLSCSMLMCSGLCTVGAAEWGREAEAFMYARVCETKLSFFASNQLSLLDKLPIRIGDDLTSFPSWQRLKCTGFASLGSGEDWI